MSSFHDYQHAYPNIRLERQDGVLQMSLHTQGGPLRYGTDRGGIRDQLGAAFHQANADPETRVVILTGTGDSFLTEFDTTSVTEPMTAAMWSRIFRETNDMLMAYLEIGVPVIGIINGPAAIHAELPLLSDIVLAAEDATLSDCHLPGGMAPGDGAHVILTHLLGANRARHFFYTEGQLTAAEAASLGLVAEVLPRDQLLARAWEHARKLLQKPDATLRYTRALLTHPIKKRLLEELNHGLAFEALTLYALKEA